MDVKSRLVNYYKNNQFIQKYIKGLNPITNEIVLVYNGKEKSVPIDVLEKLTDELSLINYLNQELVEEKPLNIEENIEEPKEEIIEEQSEVLETNPVKETIEPSIETLNDIKILTELKNKPALDNILRKFAINESTGLIDINKAIEIVEKNTTDEVINAIKENYAFDQNAINYDVQGRLIGEKIPDAISADDKIVTSFNNVKVYLEAAKMYPEQYTYSNEKINMKMGEYIKNIKNILNPNTKNIQGEVTPLVEPSIPKMQPKKLTKTLTSTEVKNAGFADVLVLAVIVLVYAIIIVNLILKLK